MNFDPTPQPQVIYFDNHLLVLHKPAGMLTQSDQTGDLDLLSWSKDFIKAKFDKPGNVFMGMVHRLDRPVSGLIVLARTSKAAARLTQQFAGRSTEKRYVALVEGMPKEKGGRLVDFIAKIDGKPRLVEKNHAVGKRAELSWQLLAHADGLSLVDIALHTGRPHQIRLQFSGRGLPLLGDFRYGSQQTFDGRNLALHAWALGIEHPTLKMPLLWREAPPASWLPFLDRLGHPAPWLTKSSDLEPIRF